MGIEHPNVENYGFHEVPVGLILYLMDVTHFSDYEAAFRRFMTGEEYEHVGVVAGAIVTAIHDEAIELDVTTGWIKSYHSIRIYLPFDKFRACVGSKYWDEHPRLFVDGEWLLDVFTRNHSVFGLFDAIGIKSMIQNAKISKEQLMALRDGVDLIAGKFTDVSFISFADSILLKSNWTVGHFETEIRHTYRPGVFLDAFFELRELYCRVLGTRSYIVLTQGTNEYSTDGLLHISNPGNHVSLNSLGIPFAELKAIEDSARCKIRKGTHPDAEIYLDQSFYFALPDDYKIRRRMERKCSYDPVFANGEDSYYYWFNSADYSERISSVKREEVDG
jgi:hypothetical protein